MARRGRPTDPGGRPRRRRRRLLAALAGHRAAAGRRRDPAARRAGATDRWGHLLGTPLPIGSFVISLLHVPRRCSAAARTSARSPSTSTLDPGRRPRRRHGPALRPAVGAVPAADHRRRLADPRLLHRLHGARPAPAPVLRLPQPVRRRDAHAGPLRELPRPVPRLGGRRPGVVPADRLLAAQAVRGRRRQEGVRDQPGRRHGPVARDHAGLRHLRHHRLRRHQRRGRRGVARPP